ncbi:unnamed protein product, partial [Urochloa humidicola]
RGNATEKDKRAKKKQAKQKKNSRKVKEKEREETSDSNFLESEQDGSTNHDRENSNHGGQLAAKLDNSGDGASDVSDNIDGSIEACEKETVDIESLVTSVSATVSSIRGKINNLLDSTSHITRGRSRRNRVISSIITSRYEDDLPSSSSSDRNTYGCGPVPRRDQETALLTLKDRLRELGQRLHEKEIEGRELLKAHLEKKAAAEAAAGSSSASSSDSLEKTPQVQKGPEQPLVTTNNGNIKAPSPKPLPAATTGDSNEAVPAMAASTINTKSVHLTPTPNKLEPILCEEHVSSSSQEIDRATLVPSRSVPVDKAIPSPPESPLPQVDTIGKATPALPKSPLPQADTVAKATPATTKPSASQLDKVAKAISAVPKSPASQVDKVSQHNSVSRQIPSTSISKAREDTISERAVVTSVPRTETPTPTSRPTSVPLFQALSSTPPTLSVQVSPSMSQSLAMSERPSDESSHSVPTTSQAYQNAFLGKGSLSMSQSLAMSERPSDESSHSVPTTSQAYQNAFLGKGSLNTTSPGLEQSTSIGQYTAVSQPLPAYTSTSVMASRIERDDQLPGKQSYMFGPSKSEAPDNWHSRKGNTDVNKYMWKDDVPNHQITNCNVHVHPLKDISYQQVSSSRTEHGRLGGLQYRQFQNEMPTSFVSHQQQGPVGEEFPHIDIINDLLDEDQSSVCMAASPLDEYYTNGLPFSSGGNMADSEMASLSNSGRFNLNDPYYDEGYRRAYDTQNALHRLRDGQLSTLDVYSNGRLDSAAPKPWPYSHPNPAVNLGINSNAQRMGAYTSLASGRVSGEYPEYLYRRANGQW